MYAPFLFFMQYNGIDKMDRKRKCIMPYPWETNDQFKQYPTRVISGTDILELQGTEKILIGRTIAWCNDIESTCGKAIEKAEQYYNRLVELGDIKPKETSEEMLSRAIVVMENLMHRIEKLEGERKNEPYRSSLGDDGEKLPANSREGKRGVPKIQPGQGGTDAGNI